MAIKQPIEILSECFNPETYNLIDGDYYKISHTQYLKLRKQLELRKELDASEVQDE